MTDKIILGINWELNSSATLMINGKIVSSVSEERFSKVKNDERYPKNAINYILKENKIKNTDIDFVCFISKYWSPTYSLIRHYTKFSINDYVKEQEDYWYKKIYENKNVSLLKIFKKKIDLLQYPGKKYWLKILRELKTHDHTSNKNLKSLGQQIRIEIIQKHLKLSSNQIKFIDHSFGHISYAYCSGNLNGKKSYVASLDAFGDFINYSSYLFYKSSKNNIIFKEIYSSGNSIIARMYRYITLLLGMKPNEHEYKVMGLAPYCKDKYSDKLLKIFKSFQKIQKAKFINAKIPKDNYFYFKKIFSGCRFDVIASGLQRFTEYMVVNWIKSFMKPNVSKNLCFAGGVAMNVKANKNIAELKIVNQLYIPPAPDDTSQSAGACYAFCLLNNIKTFPIKSNYLGYKIKNDYKNFKHFKRSNFRITKDENSIFRRASELLVKNKILAICRGSAEFGARALGNRSIICNPRNFENVAKINKTVKNRDFWMPFAATVIDRYSKKYFKIKGSNSNNYKYMTNCLDTNPVFYEKLQAVIHPYDKTCRPQILTKSENPFYYKLINQFGKLSGVYAILNTSFNTHGNPIINDEKEAIKVFKNTNIDALILENLLIEKRLK